MTTGHHENKSVDNFMKMDVIGRQKKRHGNGCE